MRFQTLDICGSRDLRVGACVFRPHRGSQCAPRHTPARPQLGLHAEATTSGRPAPNTGDHHGLLANVTIVATPVEPSALRAIPNLASPVSLICPRPDTDVAKRASRALQKLGLHEVDTIGLSDTPRGKTVISILDIEEENKAFIRDDTPTDEFRQFRDFISTKISPSEAGGCLLWLTKPSQMQCTDPQYAAILDLLPVVRKETGLALCTLKMEEDSGHTDASWKSFIDVYHKVLRTRSTTQPQDDIVSPDCEFAYRRGNIYLPRFHSVSVSDELVITAMLQSPNKLHSNVDAALKKLLQQ